MKKSDKLNKIALDNSQWKEKAIERRQNRTWQKHAQKIAVKILRAMRKQGLKQKQLAGILGVSPQQISKIVKAQENLTLQSIAKLEDALGIDLMFTEVNKTEIIHHRIIIEKPVYFKVVKTVEVSKQKVDYNPNQLEYLQNNQPEIAI